MDMYICDKELKAMEKAFSSTLGSEILARGVKVIQGKVWPERKYIEGFYNWKGNNLFADAIIEDQDGTRHTLTMKLSRA